ncbi:unnamed protein product [Acanthoscelides obtectus]|uniref:Uncharacterized protein n=2 Tax=Acanthoscelides obtectus TaxID=200917 RepID=A0A9P0MBR8_ACAOB|nr:unnamed protein product [Acanthoscelides obtectus]CAK1647569.1 hypothetical protein AOBTE_LOCUS15271 [Acanthoscelides obtectus]
MVGAAATRRCFEAVPCSRSSDRCETVSQSSKQRTHHQVTRQSSTSESMEKELQPESMATVTIKPEYPPSEVYGSEPPPAYHKPHSAAVQITKIAAVTVVLCSVVLGCFLLASAYVTANASCRQLEQELELLSEAADRFQSPPQPEALVQDEPSHAKRHTDPLTAEETQHKTAKEIETNNIDNDDKPDSSESSDSSDSEEDKTPIQLKLPLQLDLDELTQAFLEKNQRSKMNCIVEKKKAEELVDHQPKTIRLPFGVNLTTDPRLERLSGERMVIICESGTMQRAQPMPSQPQEEQSDSSDDQEEDTIMIQPVMIPIPATSYQTHMPQRMVPPPMVQRAPMRGPVVHPMEAMRPPMPPVIQASIQMQEQPQAQQQPEFPPNPILHHIVQQIIAQKIMESQRAREEQMRQQQMQQMEMQRAQEIQRAQMIHRQMQEQQMREQAQQEQMEQEQRIPHRFDMPPQAQVVQRIPIPEEVLTQLNRLPNRDVIVAVSSAEGSSSAEQEPQQTQQPQQQQTQPQPEQETVQPPQQFQVQQEIRFVQEPRQSAVEMNGRQAYARAMPVDIPVAMMPQEQQEPQQDQQEQQSEQTVAIVPDSEEARPHYVHPRSV